MNKKKLIKITNDNNDNNNNNNNNNNNKTNITSSLFNIKNEINTQLNLNHVLPAFPYSKKNVSENFDNYYICFNPYCTFSYSRIFKIQHLHKNVDACKNWIISFPQLTDCLQHTEQQQPNNIQTPNKYQYTSLIELNFIKNSIFQNIESLNLITKIDWNEYFKNLKMGYLKKIDEEFQNMFLNVGNKINSIRAQDAISCLKQLRCNIETKTKNESEIKKQIQHLIQNYISPIMTKTITIQCQTHKQLQLPSFPKFLQPIQQKLLQTQNPLIPNQQQKITQQKHESFKKYILDNISPFNKFQQIISICGKKYSGYQIKNKFISLKCPFCKYISNIKYSNYILEQQLKCIKKQVVTSLLHHCFNHHYDWIFVKYQEKIFKKTISSSIKSRQQYSKQLTFQQFLTDLQTSTCRKLHIIDRQSGISNQAIKKQLDIYQLQILSKPNKAMAKIKYILTNDRKCTEFMIIYVVVYVCLVANWFDVQMISIQSKSLNIDKVINVIQILNKKGENGSKIQNRKFQKLNWLSQNFNNNCKRQGRINQLSNISSQQSNNIMSEVKIQNQHKNSLEYNDNYLVDQFQKYQKPQLLLIEPEYEKHENEYEEQHDSDQIIEKHLELW